MCDIKPQEMIGKNYPNCRNLFVLDKGPSSDFIGDEDAHWKQVDGKEHDHTEESSNGAASKDDAIAVANMDIIAQMQVDFDILQKYNLVDYSWLVMMAEPKVEIADPNLFGPLAIKRNSGHFVFVGVIDPFVTYTTKRVMESVLKSVRVLMPNVAEIQSPHGSFRFPNKMLQHHKFHEYAQKQFLLGVIYFACVDAQFAMGIWHKTYSSRGTHPLECGTGYPRHIPDGGKFNGMVGEKIELFQ